MNQIARGGDDPTPQEGGTTRVPQTSQSTKSSSYKETLRSYNPLLCLVASRCGRVTDRQTARVVSDWGYYLQGRGRLAQQE